MSCVTIGGQEVSARSMLPHSKRPLIGSLFNKSKQSPRDHNRRLLQQNLPFATNTMQQTVHTERPPRGGFSEMHSGALIQCEDVRNPGSTRQDSLGQLRLEGDLQAVLPPHRDQLRNAGQAV